MADETFAEATMRKLRELERSNADKDREIRLLKQAIDLLKRERDRRFERDDPWDSQRPWWPRKHRHLCEQVR